MSEVLQVLISKWKVYKESRKKDIYKTAILIFTLTLE